MSEREVSEKQHLWLVGEVGCWRERGLLSAEQGQSILALYGTPEERARRRGDRALFTLSGLAAFLVGLAVFLLIGYNWELLPSALKLTLVFAVLLAAHLAGFLFRYRLGNRLASEVVFFLAYLFDGAAIALVAQIMNINSDNPDGLWWWALGVLPFAICLDTALLHALVVGILAFYAGYSAFGPHGLASGVLGWLHLPANAAYSLPLMTLPGLVWAYRAKSARVVAMYVPLLTWWAVLQPLSWNSSEAPVYFIGGVGGLLLLIAECHERESLLAIPYRVYGALLTAGVLILLSYYAVNKELATKLTSVSLMVQMAVVVFVGLAILNGAFAMQRARGDSTTGLARAIRANASRLWLPVGIILFLTVLAIWGGIIREPLFPTLLANIGMVALSFWLMYLGLSENRGQPFSAGVLYFLLWAILRYIDLFGDFGGMLGAALMFFLCGATLFGLGQYWKSRRGAYHATTT